MKQSYRILIQFVVFGVVLAIFAYGFTSTQKSVDASDLARVKEAIQKAALECYSIEGRYPEDVSYLEEYYGLYLQKDSYSIRYEYIGGNIMPETNVYVKERK